MSTTMSIGAAPPYGPSDAQQPNAIGVLDTAGYTYQGGIAWHHDQKWVWTECFYPDRVTPVYAREELPATSGTVSFEIRFTSGTGAAYYADGVLIKTCDSGTVGSLAPDTTHVFYELLSQDPNDEFRLPAGSNTRFFDILIGGVAPPGAGGVYRGDLLCKPGTDNDPFVGWGANAWGPSAPTHSLDYLVGVVPSGTYC